MEEDYLPVCRETRQEVLEGVLQWKLYELNTRINNNLRVKIYTFAKHQKFIVLYTSNVVISLIRPNKQMFELFQDL